MEAVALSTAAQDDAASGLVSTHTPEPQRRPEGLETKRKALGRAISDEDRAKARAAQLARRAAWVPVRQPHAEDREYLKAILRSKGISRIPEAEPATVGRLRQLLRRAGVSQGEAEEGVAMWLDKLISANPGVALWWLTATTLEIVGGMA